MKSLGIIGGMGPLATIDLFQKIVELTNAPKDQDNIPIIIDNYPQIPDRSAFILGQGMDPYPYMKESALRLKNAGAEAILIACNTAHYFANRLEKDCEVNILNITDIAIKAIKNKFPNAKKIAVIGTAGTKKAKIYGGKLVEAGYTHIKVTNEQMDILMDCIYKGAKANKLNDYIDTFNDVISQIDADVYIAACTEIPLFLPFAKNKDKFIDATLELARAGVKFSLEK